MNGAEILQWIWAGIVMIVVPLAFVYIGWILWEVDFSAFVLYCVLVSIFGYMASLVFKE